MKKSVEERMIDYLDKTSKHLFERSGQIKFMPSAYKYQTYMLKIFNIKIGDVDHICKVEFNDEVVNVCITELGKNIPFYKNHVFNVLKNDLFPNYDKDEFYDKYRAKSIKNYKRIKDIMSYINKSKYESVDEVKSFITKLFEE